MIRTKNQFLHPPDEYNRVDRGPYSEIKNVAKPPSLRTHAEPFSAREPVAAVTVHRAAIGGAQDSGIASSAAGSIENGRPLAATLPVAKSTNIATRALNRRDGDALTAGGEGAALETGTARVVSGRVCAEVTEHCRACSSWRENGGRWGRQHRLRRNGLRRR